MKKSVYMLVGLSECFSVCSFVVCLFNLSVHLDVYKNEHTLGIWVFV